MKSVPIFAALILAALLEVGGDALVRSGLRGGRVAGFVAGAAVLFAYGVVVNAPRWNFGRLLGVYIAVFFVVSQLVAYFAFRDRPTPPIVLGGALVIAGGLVMAFWKVK